MIRKLCILSLGAILSAAGLASARAAPPTDPVCGEWTAPRPETGSPFGTAAGPLEADCDVDGGPRLTLRAEYLLWWLKAARTPPLLTTSADPADSGTLGMPTTGLLAGGRNTHFDAVSGGRLFADYRLGDAWSVQVGGFLLAPKTRTFGVASNAAGAPTIGVPFLSAFDGSEQANVIAAPDANSGGASARYTSLLWGAEANISALAIDGLGWGVKVLGGFRHANLHEELRLDTNSTLLVTPGLFNGTVVDPGTTFIAHDSFGTRNAFYGGQLGVEVGGQLGIFSLSAFTKVAVGLSHELSSIGGISTAVMPDGTRTTAAGGTLAQTSNIGRMTSDKMAVLPELGLNLGVNVSKRVSLFAGYQFLYWSDVVRPGDQVDRVVNSNLIPVGSDGTRLGPQLPSATLRHTDFWAQGVSFGVNFAW